MGNEIRQKHTAEPPLAPGGDLEAVLDRLTIAQIRFVVARNATAFDKDAARAIGLGASTVKSWPRLNSRISTRKQTNSTPCCLLL